MRIHGNPAGPDQTLATPRQSLRQFPLLAAAGLAVLAASCSQTVSALDNTTYCNAVQNRVGFIRYPLGTIGVWSSGLGEAADVITRAPHLYPSVNSVVARAENDDWRA